jgi:hypothetical protein
VGLWEESHAPPERGPPAKEITVAPSYRQVNNHFLSFTLQDPHPEWDKPAHGFEVGIGSNHQLHRPTRGH